MSNLTNTLIHPEFQSWTRRSFLGVAAPLAAALPFAGRLRAAAAKPIPVAVQLYSVRGDCQTDFDTALAQVAAMGFAGVEFAGYYGYADRAADLRKRLDTLGLGVAGTHVALSLLQGDALKKTIDFHSTIGCRVLIVPNNPDFTNPEKCKALADVFNEVSATLKPLGMACGYHNHTHEFDKTGDTTYWDLFAERTSKDVILQQDCGWSWFAGVDPVAYIKKYPGRSRTVHFKPAVRKDDGHKAILGQDSVDWPAVLAACASTGGTEWIVLEQETYPDGRPAMDCTRDSLAGLKKILA
jgi:sugar phosphate isomerase/epimerase